MDFSLLGSSVHGIYQALTLEWVAIIFFRESFWSRDWIHISCIAGGFFYHYAIKEAYQKYFSDIL